MALRRRESAYCRSFARHLHHKEETPMKKLFAVLLTALMLLSLVSAFAEEQITLQLWSVATESDSSHQSFIDAIAIALISSSGRFT